MFIFLGDYNGSLKSGFSGKYFSRSFDLFAHMKNFRHFTVKLEKHEYWYETANENNDCVTHDEFQWFRRLVEIFHFDGSENKIYYTDYESQEKDFFHYK